MKFLTSFAAILAFVVAISTPTQALAGRERMTCRRDECCTLTDQLTSCCRATIAMNFDECCHQSCVFNSPCQVK
ncbi:cys-rich secreted peptide protein, putative [Phytophthora infestans T30-4]|uniref:Cys-rich secreted peptide protein, putative n=1 Tax=Phytophthora infestans (strain T30-4) TaxID=403677 RepID=D0N0X1_PHYIT|nr:cys-rich secreted peptide protein, putative [Phytophthora infestans T30-4]XP_002905932.1 cys-rich secreted peptide protein, putative [Phytophthora infestans T30-4]EEY55459.1 cys-rich secreted peptide protein, putative [Phytophthora infestans T30-4]EEY67284.1 cys-rich secreted peptide protein, putative [Phytophthora infestans T30-4]|eukprot:XP_002895641.1 cys-rich secreted peptide protein, putative [Phytophthora infestans T30-4]